jgi:hypothetical protein
VTQWRRHVWTPYEVWDGGVNREGKGRLKSCKRRSDETAKTPFGQRAATLLEIPAAGDVR